MFWFFFVFSNNYTNNNLTESSASAMRNFPKKAKPHDANETKTAVQLSEEKVVMAVGELCSRKEKNRL